jgi:phospholipid/cholesterol/gamma-HCH transport system ATP-binding protein
MSQTDHPASTWADSTQSALEDEEHVVRIQGLWTVFRSAGAEHVVHKDLSLQVRRGEMMSLVGGSGTGKTVLLRKILGLDTPDRGTVEVLGRPAAELGREGAASRVGMLFQHGALYSAFSVLDNIAFALRELKNLPDRLVLDAAHVKLQMVGLDTRHANKKPADLSGGMIKRVALARALALDPPLLLLDEPTAGLDPESSDAFCALLKSLHAELGITVIMVTHDLDTIFELSSSVAVLADKQVLIHAPPQEVVRHPHPFVEDFFRGGRGRRAMAAMKPLTNPAALTPSASPSNLV